jgi:hypothetical protein
MAKRKNLGKLALLGGAALLASRMMGKKGEDKKDVKAESKEDRERDAREAMIASMAKKRETPTETGAGADAPRDRLADLEKATPTRTPTRTVPTRTAPRADTSRANEIPSVSENLGASGMPREARGVTAGSDRAVDPRLGTFGSMGKNPRPANPSTFKKGGAVKSSASKRADGICKKGKTKGRMV